MENTNLTLVKNMSPQDFPKVFCITNVVCQSAAAGGYCYKVVLYHDKSCIVVTFDSPVRHPMLKDGCFVSVHWPEIVVMDHGSIKVNGLGVRNCCAGGFNPFLSVPYGWSVDRYMVDYAREFWDNAPGYIRSMLTSVLTSHFACRSAAKFHGGLRV